MNTPTHALINWTVARWWGGESVRRRAVLFGSIAPDLPLYVLSLGGVIYYRYFLGWEPGRVARQIFGYHYFHDPLWIASHNLLHSPTMVGAILLMLLWRCGREFWRSSASWFFASCMLHALVDIPVHHDDGPLLFWPLNWQYRFASPVSYWDPRHYGVPMMIGETILFLVLMGLVVGRWVRAIRTRGAAGGDVERDSTGG